MKRILIILLFCQAQLFAQDRLMTELHTFQANENLKNSSWSLSAKNLSTGEEIVSINSDQSLIPASTMKLITTGIALEVLKPDFRFKTYLGFTGKIEDDVLMGDLIVIGGGDPSLGMGEFEEADLYNSWKNEIKALGIRKIEGNLLADISHYSTSLTPETWIYQDLGNYYGASPSALSYRNNTFKISFAQSPKEGDPTRVISPKESEVGVSFVNEVVSGSRGSGDNAYVYGFPGGKMYYLRGTIPPGTGTFIIKASIPDPPGYFLHSIRSRFEKDGIEIVGNDSIIRAVNFGYSVIDTFFSPTLPVIIKEVNVNSNNLFAEHLLLELSSQYPDINQNKVIKEFFESNGIYSDGLFTADGSGLSRYNSINTSNHISFLEFMHDKKNFQDYLSSFPIGGKTGTVSDILKNTGDAIFYIKSGTLSRVKAYAGYIEKDGNTIAFSFIVNNYSGSSSTMKKSMERVLMGLAE